MKVCNRASTTPESADAARELGPGQLLPRPPWHRHPGILAAVAFAALVPVAGIAVSGPGELGTAPADTTRTNTPWSASFSLIATGFWTPDPAPPAVAPPAPEPAPPQAAAPAAPPPEAAPPPPPPPQLVLTFSDPLTAVVSMTNNANNPPVGCVYRSVAVNGPAAAVNFNFTQNFTVTGSAPTTINSPQGPATGSNFHVTVNCDNGLSTSHDGTY
jgi:hypothetical protein